MPNSIISKKPTIYQFGLHIQYQSVESAASTAFACCKAIFATNAFNFDCLPHHVYHYYCYCYQCHYEEKHAYQETFKKRAKFGVFFASSISFCPFLSRISLLFLYWARRFFSVLGALSNLGSYSKISTEIG